MSQDDNLILSATAVVLRDRPLDFEVLLLQRNSAIKVHGGSWVFPGGKADQLDLTPELRKTDLQALSEIEKLDVCRIAACREAHEEAGIKLKASQLELCARWITPPTMKKRFDAFFFITSIGDDEISIDNSEIHDYRWLTAKDALALQARGEFPLPPPTFVTLQLLSQYQVASQAIQAISASPCTYRPKLILTETGFHSLYEDDCGYEEENLALIPPIHRLIVDSGQFEYIRPSE